MTKPAAAEAACCEYLFGLKGDDCDLAVRIHGRGYFVAGVDLDSPGDTPADDGMCRGIHEARVTGGVKRGRLVASGFELLPTGEGR